MYIAWWTGPPKRARKMEGVARQMQTCYCMCMCTDRLGGAGVAGTGIGQSNLVADAWWDF